MQIEHNAPTLMIMTNARYALTNVLATAMSCAVPMYPVKINARSTPYIAGAQHRIRDPANRAGTALQHGLGAVLAMAVLLSQLRGEPSEPLEVVVDADLVVRASTAPPR